MPVRFIHFFLERGKRAIFLLPCGDVFEEYVDFGLIVRLECVECFVEQSVHVIVHALEEDEKTEVACLNEGIYFILVVFC